ncbi:MAG TPA: sensor histidine kinase [Solirubrobacterales bacterium]|nr:sensor histidine kinase [Solirubrobacterales bacterium]
MNAYATKAPPQDGLVHQAQFYESGQDFVDAALPFVREGVRAGEPVLARVRAANAAALREALGDDLAAADVGAAEGWYENPSRTRRKFLDWAGRHSDGAAGRRIRVLGEPPWPLESEAGIREWARHEAVINLAFEGWPVSFVCPYDAGALPAAVLGHAESTHPEILDASGVAESPSYADPRAYCSRLNRLAPERDGPPAAAIAIEFSELGALRRVVAREAVAAGLDLERAADLVLAVNEVATNALVHGAQPATLRVWRDSAALVCEVSDAGGGIDDPIAGQLEPALGRAGGCGLWTARLLCDSVEYRAGASGSAVALHMSLDGRA